MQSYALRQGDDARLMAEPLFAGRGMALAAPVVFLNPNQCVMA